MVGMLALLSPVQSLANTQIKATRAGDMTAPQPVVQAAPTTEKSFRVGLLAPSTKKAGAGLAVPQRVSKFIHRWF